MMAASTCFMRNTTVSRSGASMLSICEKEGWRAETTPSGGARMRS